MESPYFQRRSDSWKGLCLRQIPSKYRKIDPTSDMSWGEVADKFVAGFRRVKLYLLKQAIYSSESHRAVHVRLCSCMCRCRKHRAIERRCRVRFRSTFSRTPESDESESSQEVLSVSVQDKIVMFSCWRNKSSTGSGNSWISGLQQPLLIRLA